MQDYKLTSFKAGDYQDPHGNTWCDAAFEGVSEPVKMVVKDPRTKIVGESYYGEITDETSKAGKPYRRFRPKQRPDGQYTSSARTETPSDKPTEEYWEDKNSAIKAQWAIGQSVGFWSRVKTVNELGALPLDGVESLAESLFAMVDRVSGKVEPQLPLIADARKSNDELDLEMDRYIGDEEFSFADTQD